MSPWQTSTITPYPHRSLQEVARHVHEISSLPIVALRVMEVTSDANIRGDELKAILESDVALSARVLRLVNSSAYGLRHPVTNLEAAIAYLGSRPICNLALTASISDLFKRKMQIGRYSRAGLWTHSVSVGICSRMVAMRRGVVNPEDIFLAGLLHDIGIILEDQYDHANFVRMISSLAGNLCLSEAERRELGYSHMELGATITQRWRFPALATAAIRFHHHAVVPPGEHCQAIRCVQVANVLCTAKNFSSVGFNLVKPPMDAIDGLNLLKLDLDKLLADTDEEFQRHSVLLGL